MTIVEASFALPILILFIAGLIDLGLWTLESNKASNATRDGARAGIIVHLDADDVVGDDRTAIVDAVEAHLPGRTLSASDVAISCVDPDGNSVVGGCAAARLDVDRIRVAVRWDHELITPLAPILGLGDVEARGQATMVIVGRALPATGSPASTTTTTSTPGPTTTTTAPGSTTTTTTTAPSTCSVTDLEVSPESNSAKNSGALQNNVDVSFSVGAAATCSTLVVQVEAPNGSSASHTCGCGAGASRSWTYGKNSDNFWTAGEATVRVFNGASVVASVDFTVN